MILIAELFTKKNSGEIARKRLKHLLTADLLPECARVGDNFSALLRNQQVPERVAVAQVAVINPHVFHSICALPKPGSAHRAPKLHHCRVITLTLKMSETDSG